MKMKDVIISITGVQQGGDGTDEMELVTAGRYGVENGEVHFTYQESELTGLEGTQTSFSVSPARVIMSREGKLNTSMVFEEGKKHYFLYETPYGAATMGVDTRRIRSRLGAHGGDMEIDYAVDVEHMVVGQNSFKISVREPEASHTGDIRWPI